MDRHPAAVAAHGPWAVLTVNAGSSSIKAAVFEATAEMPVRVARAEVTGIRKQASLVTQNGDADRDTIPLPGVRDHSDAMIPLLDRVAEVLGSRTLAAVGHRIVHGGDEYTGPVVATPQILEGLERLAPRAPMHRLPRPHKPDP